MTGNRSIELYTSTYKIQNKLLKNKFQLVTTKQLTYCTSPVSPTQMPTVSTFFVQQYGVTQSEQFCKHCDENSGQLEHSTRATDQATNNQHFTAVGNCVCGNMDYQAFTRSPRQTSMTHEPKDLSGKFIRDDPVTAFT